MENLLGGGKYFEEQFNEFLSFSNFSVVDVLVQVDMLFLKKFHEGAIQKGVDDEENPGRASFQPAGIRKRNEYLLIVQMIRTGADIREKHTQKKFRESIQHNFSFLHLEY